ncbi:uncharacterized protein LOC133645705 isoform X3 [Entelurus aequoreus]|uniref:uncharacterized protein LOC133645705 isoform X3 n=1 Tax=Entelurus aequoreus TaxID=161455 RepID=UPI002B1D0128|nr:uncharacterized protein LOC133645705 isoform X3 [Entelurus aequoreus]
MTLFMPLSELTIVGVEAGKERNSLAGLSVCPLAIWFCHVPVVCNRGPQPQSHGPVLVKPDFVDSVLIECSLVYLQFVFMFKYAKWLIAFYLIHIWLFYCRSIAQHIVPGSWSELTGKDMQEIPRQTSGNDCGVFMLMYSLWLCTDTTFHYSVLDMQSIRRWWCVLLMERFGIEGCMSLEVGGSRSRTHAVTGRTCKLHTERSRAQDRTQDLRIVRQTH